MWGFSIKSLSLLQTKNLLLEQIAVLMLKELKKVCALNLQVEELLLPHGHLFDILFESNMSCNMFGGFLVLLWDKGIYTPKRTLLQATSEPHTIARDVSRRCMCKFMAAHTALRVSLPDNYLLFIILYDVTTTVLWITYKVLCTEYF